MKKRLIKIITSCLIIVGIGAAGYFSYTKYIGNKTVAAAVNYTTAKVSNTNLQVKVQGTGTVYAAVTRDVVSNNNGELKDLSLKEGDLVKKGDKIAQVYTSTLQEEVNKADINLQKQKLQIQTSKTDVDAQIQQLSIEQGQKDLNNAILARDNMNVIAPIGGLVVTRVSNNGDTLQSGKAIVSIVDTSSYKIKVNVDELDIAKIENGQTAEIKFDALENKVYEGAVESIAQIGDTENNVTTYGVVISIKDLEGIKMGMNASINILIESKESVMVVPVEALVEKNNLKYVMVSETQSSVQTNSSVEIEGKTNDTKSQMGNMTEEQRTAFLKENPDIPQNSRQRQNKDSTYNEGTGNLVEVKTGIENEKYIEIISGLTEGQTILITLPTAISNTKTGASGAGGGFNAGMTGGRTGAPRN